MEEDFYNQVFELVRLIPGGRVTSYGAIARSIGSAGSARMVGYAMSNAGLANPPVPAHRVVNGSGLLTGRFHFTPSELMEQLLTQEGILVEHNKVIHFKKHFWDPMEEL